MTEVTIAGGMIRSSEHGIEAANRVYKAFDVPASHNELASEAAWQLLRNRVRHRMEDGSILVPDSLARWHRLSVSPIIFPTAEALPRGEAGGNAIITQGMFELIDYLCKSLWCQPGFMPAFDDVRPVTTVPFASTLPLLSETFTIASVGLAEQPKISKLSKELIGARLAALSDERRFAAVMTSHYALQWVWAHELGHLTLGHLTSEVRQFAKVGDAVLGLEILADKFACRFLFQKDVRSTAQETCLAFIGFLAVLSLLNAESIVLKKPWVTSSHAGSWFRAQLVLRYIEANAAGIGLLEACAVSVESALGHFGDWIATAFDKSSDSIWEGLHRDAMAALCTHRAAAEASLATLIPDSQCLSTDLVSSAKS